MDMLREIAKALIEGDSPRVKALTEAALNAHIPPLDILNNGLITGMDVIGQQFRSMEISIPEVFAAARAMDTSLELLKPHLSAHETTKGTFVIGTVKGDIHDIGKTVVSMLMEGAGFTVIDLGVDVPAETFCEAIRRENPDIVGMSALLTVTMQEMETVIKAITEAGLRNKVKIMVGGACVTQEFADRIGADAYGEDARDAVEKAKRLLGIE